MGCTQSHNPDFQSNLNVHSSGKSNNRPASSSTQAFSSAASSIRLPASTSTSTRKTKGTSSKHLIEDEAYASSVHIFSLTEAAKSLPGIYLDLGDDSELSESDLDEPPNEEPIRDDDDNSSVESEGAIKAKILRERLIQERSQRNFHHLVSNVNSRQIYDNNPKVPTNNTTNAHSPNRTKIQNNQHDNRQDDNSFEVMIREFKAALNLQDDEEYIHGILNTDHLEGAIWDPSMEEHQ